MTDACDNGRLIGGRYALEKIIGEGARGEVWRARHTTLQSLVAIKFLHGSAAFRESTRKRFLKEAQVAALLNTRHAVRVFDFGVTEQGRPYLIMELLDGETLARRLVRLGRLTPEQTAHILKLASRALDRAHAMGIVHRDFKPENIFLSENEDGETDVKVVDFGVAKLVGDLEGDRDDEGPASQPPIASPATFTRTGATVGTPSYMSPEQASAQARITPAADIWAMGVVAYECLAGVRPFQGSTLQELFENIARCACTPAHELHPDIPPAFDEWFRTACNPHPSRRFPDAAIAAAALLEALGVQPNARAMLDAEITASISRSFHAQLQSHAVDASAAATPTSHPHVSSKLTPFVRSNRRIDRTNSIGRILVGVLAAAAIVIVGVLVWRWSRRTQSRPPATASQPAMMSAPSLSAEPAPGPVASAELDSGTDADSTPTSRGNDARDLPPARIGTRPVPPSLPASGPMDVPVPPAAMETTMSPPSPSAPPAPSATKTVPSSPFQLPDLGL